MDTSHLDDAAQKIAASRPQELPALWDSSITQVGSMLRAGNPAEFPLALERASRPVMALIARDPDLAIFQVVRQDEGDISHYASRHAAFTSSDESRSAGCQRKNSGSCSPRM